MPLRKFVFFATAVGCAATLFSASASAVEKLRVCAKQGNGRSYQVEASLYDGSELNSATKSIRFTSFSKYVVIFWSQNEASIIELNHRYIGVTGVDGTDQEGRKWEVSTSSICF